MTIELNCPHCHKFLRTADDKAGLTANCPGCGEQITIPAIGDPGPEPVIEPDEPLREDERTPCPLCGGLIRRSARRCRYCGEVLAPELAGSADYQRSTSLDLGDLMRDAWAIYRDNFGLLFGGAFVAGLIIAIPNIAMFPVSFSVAFQQPDNHLLQNELSLLTSFLQLLVAGFMMGGLVRLMTNAVRGENPRFSDIFRGGRYYFRMVFGLFLAYFATAVGCCLLIAPGAFLMSAFGPWLFLLVDQNLGLFASFGEAWRITRGHWLQVFVILLVNLMLLGASYVACVLPVLFMAPFNWVMYILVCERLKKLASQPERELGPLEPAE